MRQTPGEPAGQPPGSSDQQGPNRRRFLDYLLGTSAVATLGAIVYPIFRFMSPPQVIESAESSAVAAKLTEIPINSGKIFKFGNKPGILVRTATGEFKAFSAVCTHLECIVQYRPDTKQIWCACHNGQYNLGGKNIGGPPPRPLEEYKVNTRGDDVVVTKA
jgi:cytochrome b6-f complex iron-sulfur subunit